MHREARKIQGSLRTGYCSKQPKLSQNPPGRVPGGFSEGFGEEGTRPSEARAGKRPAAASGAAGWDTGGPANSPSPPFEGEERSKPLDAK
eukprot:1209344-Pyramimonas_sp.AAC.1